MKQYLYYVYIFIIIYDKYKYTILSITILTNFYSIIKIFKLSNIKYTFLFKKMLNYYNYNIIISSGTIWTDFKPQIEGLDKEKFTIIAWDPPGYGKSRPPDRTYPDDFFQRDAIWACDLMKALGYTKFSLIGWSDGAITSLILASMFPDNVQKMVALAANAYVTPEEKEIYKSLFIYYFDFDNFLLSY